MENWKEKAKILLDYNIFMNTLDTQEQENYLLNIMKEFALLACEEQKEICVQHSKLFDYVIDPEDSKGDNEEEPEFWFNCNGEGIAVDIDSQSIRNAPTVKFD